MNFKNKKLALLLFISLMLIIASGCNSYKINVWNKMALNYNEELYDKCRRVNLNCESDHTFGEKMIVDFTYKSLRYEVLRNYLNKDSGDVVLYEFFGHGEVITYYIIVYNLKKSDRALKYNLGPISNSNKIESINLSNNDIIKLKELNYLDFISRKNFQKGFRFPNSFISYTKVINGKVKAVQFIVEADIDGTIMHDLP